MISVKQCFTKQRSVLARFTVMLGSIFLSSSIMANPVLDNVTHGDVSIQQTSTTTTINQSSQQAIINWREFNIQQGEHTHFEQPQNGVALNRISATQGASEIYGQLSATGQIILVNPAGVFFGPSAFVNVGGIIATTANISNTDFLSGNYRFNQLSPDAGMIINKGTIIAAQHGLVMLLGNGVQNDGTIVANLGTVGLGSGSDFTVDFVGNGLVNFAVNAGSVNGISHSGSISANGGRVQMTARAASNVLDQTINLDGIVEAKAVALREGEIILQSDLERGMLIANSELNVSGKNAGEHGGSVSMTGSLILVDENAHIDASGDAGGGTVYIGGNYLGQGPLPNAKAVAMLPGARINADAITSGNGGEVILWSDEFTQVHGEITARGGALSGNGGFIETSSKGILTVGNLAIDVSANNGLAGTWLLDPADLTVTASNANVSGSSPFTPTATGATLAVTTLTNALASGNVTILTSNDGFTGSGNIIIATPISWDQATALLLDSYNNISINAAITAPLGSLNIQAGSISNTITTSDAGDINVANFNLLRGEWRQVVGLDGLTALPDFNISNNFQITSGVMPSADAMFLRAAGGNGSSGSPYQLTDIYGIQGLGSNTQLYGNGYGQPALNDYFEIINDIDASMTRNWNDGKGFVPIAQSGGNFYTTIEGNGYVIKDFYINRPTENYVGMIAKSPYPGWEQWGVYNLGLIDPVVIGQDYVGTLGGQSGTWFSNVFAVNITVSGRNYVGGLVGYKSNKPVQYGYTEGSVSGSYYVGGLTGRIGADGDILQSYSTATVVGTDRVGGLIGQYSSTNTQLTNSYSSGSVSGTGSYVGGLVGQFESGVSTQITSSFFDSDTSGQASGCGGTGTGCDNISGGIFGSGTGQLANSGTYTSWDIGTTIQTGATAPSNVWFMFEGQTRPMLMGELFETTTPRAIHTAHQLQLMGTTLGASYQLAADIDLTSAFNNKAEIWGTNRGTTGTGFIPIGIDGSHVFTGSFDGNNHAISNLYMNKNSNGENIALFGNVDATIHDLILFNSYVHDTAQAINNVAALAGFGAPTIYNVSIINADVAGLGSAFAVGGLIGTNWTGGDIDTSYVTGTVVGNTTNARVGGFAGRNYASIDDSYALVNVSDGLYAGGFAGTSNGGHINTSYSTGSAAGTSAGGFVGSNLGGTYSNNFFDTATAGTSDAQSSGAVTGVIGSTFDADVNPLNTSGTYTGWSIGTSENPATNVWVILDEQTRPMLAMEIYDTNANAGAGAIRTDIRTAHQLQLIDLNGNTRAADYTLGNNIDMSGTNVAAAENATDVWGTAGFDPIGTNGANYSGTFDGNGFAISNLTIYRPNTQYIGLFGYLSSSANVSNVGVSSGTYTGYRYVGGIAGFSAADITNSYNKADLVGTNSSQRFGGIAGELNSADITNSYNSGSITVGNTVSYVGGIAGKTAGSGSSISYTFNEGNITFGDSGNEIGGMFGQIGSVLDVDYTYNTGNITGGTGVTRFGSYAGSMFSAGTTIDNSYNIGAVDVVSGGYRAGGFIGDAGASGTVTNVFNSGYHNVPGGNNLGFGTTITRVNAYWNSDLSVQSVGYTTPKTNTQMMTETQMSGFDFNTTWGIIEGQSYPYLQAFYSSAPRVISGTVSGDTGGTNVVLNTTSTAEVKSVTTGANGFYYMLDGDNAIANTSGQISDGDKFIIYLSGSSTDANVISVAQSSGASSTDLDMTANEVTVKIDSGTASLSNTDFSDLIGNGGSDIIYTVPSNVTVNSPSDIAFDIASGAILTFNGGIDGSGDFIKLGDGEMRISGASLGYTGSTTIDAGTLQARINNALPSATALHVDGTFDFYGFAQNSVSALTGSGSVTNSVAVPQTLTINNSSTSTYSGSIDGDLAVTKTGSGTLELTGTSSSYTGITTISQGTLSIADDLSLGSVPASKVAGAGSIVLASATLKGYDSSVDLHENRGIVLTGGYPIIRSNDINGLFTVNGDISGSANTMNVLGGSHTRFFGTNTFTALIRLHAGGGTLSINSDASLGDLSNDVELGAGGTGILNITEDMEINSARNISLFPLHYSMQVNVESGKTLIFNGAITDGSSSGVIRFLGEGTTILGGVGTYTGGTVIQNGTVILNSAQALGSSAISGLTINSNGELQLNFDDAALTYTQPISLSGGGKLVFTGNNTAIDNNITIGGSTSITNDGGIAILNGTINGAQALTFDGSGTATQINSAIGGTTPVSSVTASIPLEIDANITSSGSQTYTAQIQGFASSADVLLLASGSSSDINLNGSASYNSDNNVRIAAGRNITSSADGTVINNAGSGEVRLHVDYDSNLTGSLQLTGTSPNMISGGGVKYFYNPTVFGVQDAAPYSGGTTPTQYMLIHSLGTDSDASTDRTLGAISNDANTSLLNQNFALGTDIDASGTSTWHSGEGFDPIGDYTNAYKGYFDGQDYTVSNLYINRPGEYRVGLFGHIEDSNIQNMTISNADITAAGYTGILAGGAGQDGVSTFVDIANITVSGTVTATATGQARAGGLGGSFFGNSGDAASLTLDNVHSSATVIANTSGSGTYSLTGGLLGILSSGTVTNSSASGNVNQVSDGASGEGRGIGGFVGWAQGLTGSILTDVTSSGAVTGTYQTGGLVGTVINSTITRASSSSNVSGAERTGGLIGQHNTSTLKDSYSTGTVTGSGNLTGGIVGINWDGSTIQNSYHTTGAVTSSSGVYYTGGIAGMNENRSQIQNSYNTADVTGYYFVGGLVGENLGAIIDSSYNTGTINGFDEVGGLVGRFSTDGNYTTDSILSNSYNVGTVNGDNGSIGGLVGFANDFDVAGNVTQPRILNSYSSANVIDSDAGSSSTYFGGALGNRGDNIIIENLYYNTGSTIEGSAAVGNGGDTTGVTGLSDANMQVQGNFSGFNFSNVWTMSGTANQTHSYPKLREGVDPSRILTGSLDDALSLTLNLAIDGVSQYTLETSSDGLFTFIDNNKLISNTSDILLYLDEETQKANTFVYNPGSNANVTNIDVLIDQILIGDNSNTQTFNLSDAGNYYVSTDTADMLFSVSGNNMTVASGGYALQTGSSTTLNLDGNLTTNNGDATFNGALLVGANALINSGSGEIKIKSTLDSNNGNNALTLTNSSAVKIYNNAGQNTPLSSLTINSNQTDFYANAKNVITVGNQTYNSPVDVGSTITFESQSGSIIFNDTLSANYISDYVLAPVSSGNTYTALSTYNTATFSNFDEPLSNPVAIDLGFEFEFYAGVYDTAYADPNGVIGFDLTNYPQYTCCSNNFMGTGDPNNLIALLWTDLYSSNGQVRYTTTGATGSRVTTIEYPSTSHYFGDNGQSIQVQAKLYEADKRVELHYGPVNITASDDFTIGVENPGGTSSTTFIDGLATDGATLTSSYIPDGTILTFNPVLSKGDITINGNVQFNTGGVSDVNNLTVNGASTIDANISTLGTQTYNGDATVTSTVNITASDFVQQSGTWTQNGTLGDFTISGNFDVSDGNFIRAEGGNGQSATPYQINDIYGLQGIAGSNMLNKHFILTDNINASTVTNWHSGAGFDPIGNDGAAFTGTFDGDNFTISNLTIDRSGENDVGLFGHINDASAVVENLTLSNINISGGWHSAGAIGWLANGSIDNVTVSSGTVTGNAGNDIAGIVGLLSENGTVSNVTNSATITSSSTNNVGGIVGYFGGASITNASNHGDITAFSNAGGIAGSTYDSKVQTISNSYNTGTISGLNPGGGDIGGIIGHVEHPNTTISNVFNTGDVYGPTSWLAGGIAGYFAGQMNYAYNTGDITGRQAVGGIVGYTSGNGSGVSVIENVYNTGNITGTAGNLGTGGLVGQTLRSDNVITNAYSIGVVTGPGTIGGLIGNNDAGADTTALFWDTAKSGLANAVGSGATTNMAAGIFDGTNTASLAAQATYSGFTFDASNWGIVDGYMYPYLSFAYASAPRVISGNTPASGGDTIQLAVNGTLTDSMTAYADGSYYFSHGNNALSGDASIANGSALLAFIDGATSKANAIAVAPGSGGSLINIDMSANTASLYHDGATAPATILNAATVADSDIIFGVSGSTITVNSSYLFEINASNGSLNFSDTLTGAGSFVKSGSSTVTMSGTKSYTGNTTINEGILSITSNAGLGATPGSADADNIVLNGGTLELDGSFTLATNRGTTIGANGGTYSVTNGNSIFYTGVISGSGNMTKSGDGFLGLYAVNTGFSGKTSILGGTLQVNDDNRLGAAPGSFVADQLTINGGTLSLHDNGVNTISIAANRGITIGASGGTIRTENSAKTGVINSQINGAGNLTLDGSGIITLNGLVGGSTALTGLTANARLNANNNITTSGSQSYGQLTLSNSSNITFTANGASSDITIGGATSWTGTNTFALSAGRNIIINNSITGTNGTLQLSAASGTQSITTNGSGSIDVANFTLSQGGWYQNMATLPSFAVSNDFNIGSNAFLRVTGGDGDTDAGGAYEVEDVYGLQGIGSNSTYRLADWILTDDIMNGSITANWNGGEGFVPIGYYPQFFRGTLDGQNHTIDGLTMNRTNQDIGLIGATTGSGSISNLRLTNIDFTLTTTSGAKSAGGLIGYMNQNVVNTQISNIYVSGQITAGGTADAHTGGMIGIFSGHLNNAYADVTVTGNYNVGGLIGRARFGTTTNAYAAGSVTSTGTALNGVGGLIGDFIAGTLSNSHSSARVISSDTSGYVGGLIGLASANVQNSYSTSYVSSNSSNIGGLIGSNSGSVTNSYWDSDKSGQSNSSGSTGSSDYRGYSAAEMMTSTIYSGWTFDASNWGIIEGQSYPYLRAQYATTPRAISGTSSATANDTIALASNGTILENRNAFADGSYYYLFGNNSIAGDTSIADGSHLLVYLDGAANQANTLAYASTGGASLSGSTALNLTDNRVTFAHFSGSANVNGSNFATAKGGIVDNDILFSTSGNNISSSPGLIFNVGSGATLDLTGALVSSAGNLYKEGAGTLEVSANNSANAVTYINGGTLRYGINNALRTIRWVVMADVAGANLDLNGYDAQIAHVEGGGANGGNVLLGNGTLTIGYQNGPEYFGSFIGAGDIVKINTGRISFSGDNSLFTGDLTIQGGEILATNSNATGTGNIILDGGSIRSSGADVTIANDWQVISAGGGIGGYNELIMSGDGTINADVNIWNTSTTHLTGNLSGTGTISKIAGDLTISGTDNSSYSGDVSIQTGTVSVDTDFGTGTITVNDGTRLHINDGASLANNIIVSGTGTSSQGAITASGTGTVTGSTTMNADTSFGTLASSDTLILGALDGSYALSTVGSGTVRFAGAVGGTATPTTLTADSPVVIAANVTTVGNQTFNSSVGNSGTNTLTISGNSDATIDVNSSITGSGILNLLGGGSGTYTLSAQTGGLQNFNITGTNAGTLSGANISPTINFNNFANLTGGMNRNNFIFADASKITGMVDGLNSNFSAPGFINTLDFSAFTSPVNIVLTSSLTGNGNAATATDAVAQFRNINNLENSASAGAGKITFPNKANQIFITGGGVGFINDPIYFNEYYTLTSTGGTNTITFNVPAVVDKSTGTVTIGGVTMTFQNFLDSAYGGDFTELGSISEQLAGFDTIGDTTGNSGSGSSGGDAGSGSGALQDDGAGGAVLENADGTETTVIDDDGSSGSGGDDSTNTDETDNPDGETDGTATTAGDDTTTTTDTSGSADANDFFGDGEQSAGYCSAG